MTANAAKRTRNFVLGGLITAALAVAIVLHMTRAFNVREGFTKADDIFPKRIHEAFTSGPLAGVGYGEDKLSEAVSMYYGMAGWDRETGVPRRGKLQELDIEWVADLL